MKRMTAALAIVTIWSCNSLGVSAETDFASKLSGDYTTNQRDFVTVKRLTFSKEKDGSIKIEGALVGFPDEVSIGESIPELYQQRNSNADADELWQSFHRRSSSRSWSFIRLVKEAFQAVRDTKRSTTCVT